MNERAGWLCCALLHQPASQFSLLACSVPFCTFELTWKRLETNVTTTPKLQYIQLRFTHSL